MQTLVASVSALCFIGQRTSVWAAEFGCLTHWTHAIDRRKRKSTGASRAREAQESGGPRCLVADRNGAPGCGGGAPAIGNHAGWADARSGRRAPRKIRPQRNREGEAAGLAQPLAARGAESTGH